MTIFLALAACGTDAASGEPGVITGSIAHDTVWSGTLDLHGFVTIEPGVVVTVEDGTTIRVASAASIEVDGTLDVEGVQGNAVTIAPANPGEYWLGVNVAGEYPMHYAKKTGGGIYTISPTAKLVISDSELSNAIGDYIVANDGSVDIQYSNLGLETGDHTHCNLHFNEAKNIVFTHNNNVGVAYGLMLYGGSGDFTHNNWSGNAVDIEPNPGGTGHFDDSYFARGVPGGVPGSTFENPAGARLADCGPR